MEGGILQNESGLAMKTQNRLPEHMGRPNSISSVACEVNGCVYLSWRRRSVALLAVGSCLHRRSSNYQLLDL